MTTLAILTACIALILLIGVARRKAGRAVADMALLVILLGMIGIIDLVIGAFVDTGNAAKSVAIAIAAAFLLDAIYGLMAPERQRRRDRRLRELMQRRRA